MIDNFWKDKTVLVTGHTGFKGSWLCIYLLELGANVVGYSLEPKHKNDNYNLSNLKSKLIHITGDINDFNHLFDVFHTYNPDIVFHLAAQPLVIPSYENPYETYETNIMGTLNVLESLKNLSKKAVGIMITTDKCYENKEQVFGYKETDSLGGYDMYSSSKACCEILIDSFRSSFFNKSKYNIHKKDISSVRAGNVIGGGDWSDYRLIPDCIKAFENNEKVTIRSPKSIRPWQHVLEPLSGYLSLAQKMYENPLMYSGAYNFGPNLKDIATVETLTEKLASKLNTDSLFLIEEDNTYHESSLLFLDISKAKFKLDWCPSLDLDKTLDFTVDWYLNYKTQNVYNICKAQIYEFLTCKYTSS